MAQWCHSERRLYTKLVYYGPSFGGKTTNLEALHRLTDPEGAHELVTVQTAQDRTLFFDLLPFDLGEILGYRVAIKLYTVPGQVRYETSRQVVLDGADAIVFVADSSRRREEQNRWSLQNLQMNMRKRGLDPAHVPVIYQFNKQDVDDAAAPATVAGWLGLRDARGLPAVALRGEGVVETFAATGRKMLEAIISRADERTRRQIDAAQPARQIERAFAPLLRNVRRVRAKRSDSAHTTIVLNGDDALEDAVATSVMLGERLAEVGKATGLDSDRSAICRELDRKLDRIRKAVRRASGSDGRQRVESLKRLNETVDQLEELLASLKRTTPAIDAVVGSRDR